MADPTSAAPTEDQLGAALVNAHNAGDEDAARTLAGAIINMRAAKAAPPSAPVPGSSQANPLDDITHAASAGAIARASLAPDPQVQIKRYAESFGQPESDFGIVGDRIIRRLPDNSGQYARVEPSVRGATGPIDAAERAFDWVSGGAGQTIPAVTGTIGAVGGAIGGALAGLPTGPGAVATGIAGSAAGGAAGAAAGEVARQKLDAALAPQGKEAPMDWGNVGWQAAGGAAAPIIRAGGGKIAGGVTNAVARFGEGAYDLPAGALGDIAEPALKGTSFGLSPRVVNALKQHIDGKQAELDQLRQDAQSMGVDLSLGQLTGSTAAQQAERQLMRQPEGTDLVADLRRTQNEEQIPNAVRGVLDTIAPDAPAGKQVDAFRQAAGDVINKQFKAQSAEAAPVYASALDDKPPFWSDDLSGIMMRPSMKAGWAEAQKNAAEEGYTLPALFKTDANGATTLNTDVAPSWRDWQNIKMGLNGAIDSETDPMTGKMTPDGRRLVNTKNDLMGVLYKANPDWQAADATYGSMSDATDAVLKGGVGFLNKMSGPDRQNMVNRVFSGQNLMPDDVTNMRLQFSYAGHSDEWNGAVRAYIGDKLASAMTPTQGGELSNVGGKMYRSLWGDQRQADIMQAALGGNANESTMAQWDKLGSVLKAAARQLPEGSPTATDAGAPGLIGRGVQAVKYMLHPASMGADLMDGLSKMQNPDQTQKLAGFLLTPEGDKLLKSLYPTTPGTDKANSILGTILTQAGVVGVIDTAGNSERPR